MSTYPSIEAYTAQVIAARNAHEEDREVEAGRCANLCGRKHEPKERQCWTCRHASPASVADMVQARPELAGIGHMPFVAQLLAAAA